MSLTYTFSEYLRKTLSQKKVDIMDFCDTFVCHSSYKPLPRHPAREMNLLQWEKVAAKPTDEVSAKFSINA